MADKNVESTECPMGVLRTHVTPTPISNHDYDYDNDDDDDDENRGKGGGCGGGGERERECGRGGDGGGGSGSGGRRVKGGGEYSRHATRTDSLVANFALSRTSDSVQYLCNETGKSGPQIVDSEQRVAPCGTAKSRKISAAIGT
ncbi:hypothetical protein V1478_007863 [Vespula squamosa]|uniref:Uncharacterized protein n=1 Tax=Vespula squamosa TaxID=30214 RepID=A0ABD2AXI8_VESSQ